MTDNGTPRDRRHSAFCPAGMCWCDDLKGPEAPGILPGTYPRRFVLRRTEDVTGVSGTGIVAEGVEFSNGVVALQWTSAFPTSVVFHQRGMESVKAIHGHGGATEVIWLV